MSNVAISLVTTMMKSSFSKFETNASASFESSNFNNFLNNAKTNSKTQVKDDGYDITGFRTGSRTFSKGNEYQNTESTKSENMTARQKDNMLSQKDVTELNSYEGSTKNEVSKTDEVVKKELTEGLDETADNIKEEIVNAVANELEMTSEELQELLQSLNLTVTDLFNMDNLKSLIMGKLGIEDSMGLVTTEGAVETLQSAADAIKNVVDQNFLSMDKSGEVMTIEEFQNFLTIAAEGNGQQAGSGEQSAGGDVEADLLQTAQSQSNQSQMTSGFEGVLNQVITQKVDTIVMDGQVQTIYTEVTAKDVFDQIVTGMKVEVTDGSSKMMLQLEPEHLGKIGLNISTENGTVSGQFIAESEAVKEIIEANLGQLKSQLAEQGINVADLKITVGTTDSYFTEDDQNDQYSAGKRNKRNNKRNQIGNINGVFADNISDDSLKLHESIIKENSSIELQA